MGDTYHTYLVLFYTRLDQAPGTYQYYIKEGEVRLSRVRSVGCTVPNGLLYVDHTRGGTRVLDYTWYTININIIPYGTYPITR